MFNSREHVHTTRKQTIRYVGDMSDDILDEMSPESLKKCIKKLKNTLHKKSGIIKRLQRKEQMQKKKIESLQTLVINLRKENYISSNSEEVLKI